MAVISLGDGSTAGGSNDQGGFLSWLQGLAPEAQSAIMRVMAQANPVSSANAATADSVSRAPSPLATPSPVPASLASGGPPIPPGQVLPMEHRIALGAGPGNVMESPTGTPPIVPGGGASGGGGASMPWPDTGTAPPPVQMGMPAPPGYGPETTHMPYPGQVDPKGVFAPKPPVTPIARVRAHIDPRATALAPRGGALPGYYTGQGSAAQMPAGARGSNFTPYTDPNDPRIFRGPLAAR